MISGCEGDCFDNKLHYATVPSGYKPTDGVRSKNDRMIMVMIAYLFFLLAYALIVDIVQCKKIVGGTTVDIEVLVGGVEDASWLI